MLLAFGAKGTPAVVMSIIFAGAPVVNAVHVLLSPPPAGGSRCSTAHDMLGVQAIDYPRLHPGAGEKLPGE